MAGPISSSLKKNSLIFCLLSQTEVSAIKQATYSTQVYKINIHGDVI